MAFFLAVKKKEIINRFSKRSEWHLVNKCVGMSEEPWMTPAVDPSPFLTWRLFFKKKKRIELTRKFNSVNDHNSPSTQRTVCSDNKKLSCPAKLWAKENWPRDAHRPVETLRSGSWRENVNKCPKWWPLFPSAWHLFFGPLDNCRPLYFVAHQKKKKS